jgi:hypothetical protein
LVTQKPAVPGNVPVSISVERLGELRNQLEARLRPVLREPEFAAFDLDRTFAIVAGMARAVAWQIEQQR